MTIDYFKVASGFVKFVERHEEVASDLSTSEAPVNTTSIQIRLVDHADNVGPLSNLQLLDSFMIVIYKSFTAPVDLNSEFFVHSRPYLP